MQPELYRLVIVWDMLQPDPAGPGRPGQARPRLHARQAAVRAATPASRTSCGRWPRASARAAGSRWWCSPARRSGPRAPPQRLPGRRARARARRATCAALPRAGRRPCSTWPRPSARGSTTSRPWNEPNHPYFISPQRKACDALSPVAGGRALRRAWRARRGPSSPSTAGDHQLVLGEMAGILEPSSRATGVAEMIRGLPRELVCAAPVWSQHAYIGGTDPVATVKAALRDPPLPARARDLDHRDRRRPGAGRPLARARDHQRGAGLPAAAPAPARLARRPARDRRRPVHDARGRPVPDRPGHHRPRARPAGAARVAGVGRARRSRARRRRARPAASARPGRAARGRAS